MLDYVLEITYPCDAEVDDEVQALLFLSASTGSSSIDRNGQTAVTAWFGSAEARAAAMPMFRDIGSLRTGDRKRLDWLERYEQSLEPIVIGRSFIVAPDARLFARGEKRHRIIVPQEQAFGTGSHETTSLCMEMLESIDMRSRRGLDIGSGSGILSLAMLLLGAAKVIAFDNDIDAFGPLRDNRARNDVDMTIFIGGIEALRGGRFDVITMNIVPEVIIASLPDVMARAAGDLILSGILNERRGDIVTAAARQGATLRDERSKGEWWCGRFSARR